MPSAEAQPLVSGCLTLCSLVLESLFICFLMPFYKVSVILIVFEKKKKFPFSSCSKTLRSVEVMESDFKNRNIN